MHLCLKSSMETTKVIKGIIEFKENNDRIFHHEFPCFNDFLVKSLRCTILIRQCRVFFDNVSNHQAFLDFFDKLSRIINGILSGIDNVLIRNST